VPSRVSFDYAKRWLRKRFPLRYPVRVRLVSSARLHVEHGHAVGFCTFDGTRCEILITKSASLDARIEHLHHEWAHIIRWHLPLESETKPDEHDPIFDLIHGRIRRAWHES